MAIAKAKMREVRKQAEKRLQLANDVIADEDYMTETFVKTHMGIKEYAEMVLAVIGEVERWQSLGNFDEIKDYIEKSKAKSISGVVGNIYHCPTCGCTYIRSEDGNIYGYCHDCGQKLKQE